MVRNLFTLLLLAISFTSWAKDVPDPNKGNRAFVKDIAKALTEQQEIALCNKLRAYDDSTSNQIAVLIDESLEGEDAFSYSLKVARKWGVGGKDKDNGVLIYVATRDRKTFVQVGRGLEGRIPDALAGRVVDQVLIPNFKSKGYYQGIDAAIDRLIEYAAGEYKNDRKRPKNGFPAWLIVVIVIIAVIIFSSFGDNTGTTYRGSRGGWIIGSGGYIGGGFGGGGGGGGFGGFGGGGFGGGGAGGSW